MKKKLLQRNIGGHTCIAYLYSENKIVCTVDGETIDLGIKLATRELNGDCTLAIECILKAAYQNKIANDTLSEAGFSKEGIIMGNMIYYLMHKDIKVAAFVLNGDDVIDTKINKDAVEHLPIGHNIGMSRWLHERGIPVTRNGIKARDKQSTTFNYMLKNLGLSLTDCYWLKPEHGKSNYTWSRINLFDNPFRDTISLDVDYNGNASIAGKTNFVPSASLKGDLEKKWLIDKNGNRILVKGNYGSSCIQSISEVFASEIYKRQEIKVPYTEYKFIDISCGGSIVHGCCSRAFTSDKLELVHAHEIVSSMHKPNDINYFQFYKRILQDNGIYADDVYDMQIMVDFIITNTDRHFSNFGVLRDPDTLKFVCAAPIYDSGNSMFYKDSYVPVGKALLDIKTTSAYGKEAKMLSQVVNRGILNIEKLPSSSELYKLLSKDETLTEQRKERLIRAYNKKIEYLCDFQNGADIWSYNYIKTAK